MKTGGVGGGNTLTGLNFEKKVDFQKLIGAIPGYEIKKISGKAGMGVFLKEVWSPGALENTIFINS